MSERNLSIRSILEKLERQFGCKDSHVLISEAEADIKALIEHLVVDRKTDFAEQLAALKKSFEKDYVSKEMIFKAIDRINEQDEIETIRNMYPNLENDLLGMVKDIKIAIKEKISRITGGR